jgi:hypothetical protein
MIDRGQVDVPGCPGDPRNMDPPRRNQIARRTAGAAAFAAGLCLVVAVLAQPAFGASRVSAGARHVVTGTRATAPRIKAHAAKAAKPQISIFTATPSTLLAAGGKVTLTVVVAHAKACRFSSTAKLKGLPVTKPCTSHASLTVPLPRNAQGSTLTRSFSIRATGKGGSTSVGPISVTVLAKDTQSAPLLTLQPATQSILTGTSVTFTSTATGAPSPSVHWQVSTTFGASWTNIPGATSTSYTFTTATGESGYDYRAVFTNAVASTDSNAATLTVLSPSAPAITQQPNAQAAGPGETVQFSALASGEPAPTVQWQVSTDQGATWGDVAGATEPNYSFTAASGDNFNLYRAVFTNDLNTATSNAVALAVVGRTSKNWSGYAALGARQTFTSVTGSWTVPAVTCPNTDGEPLYAAQWIGIDGYSTGAVPSYTVEQDGTDSYCVDGSPQYDAWYEMYGDDSSAPDVSSGYPVTVGGSVYPGDTITASVSVDVSGNWTLAISDAPADPTLDDPGWTSSTVIGPPPCEDGCEDQPAESSAEWIVEAPTSGSVLPLADFGSTAFTDATANGTPITDFTDAETVIANGQSLLAAPGPLNLAGNGFAVTWFGS